MTGRGRGSRGRGRGDRRRGRGRGRTRGGRRGTRRRRRSTRVVTRVHPDLQGRRVAVPYSYFGQEGDCFHGGLVGTWRKYWGQDFNEYWGYEIIFDAGDKYDLLESDVWSYLTPDCESEVGLQEESDVVNVDNNVSDSDSDDTDDDNDENLTIQELLRERFHVE